LRPGRADTWAAVAGSDLLGQLVLRRVRFHGLMKGAPIQKFDTPWTLAGTTAAAPPAYHHVAPPKRWVLQRLSATWNVGGRILVTPSRS
jgi:hypothetical protein